MQTQWRASTPVLNLAATSSRRLDWIPGGNRLKWGRILEQRYEREKAERMQERERLLRRLRMMQLKRDARATAGAGRGGDEAAAA